MKRTIFTIGLLSLCIRSIVLADATTNSGGEYPFGASRVGESAECMWGYWQPDGTFYLGHVVRREGDRYLFEFLDGETAWLSVGEFFRENLSVGDPVWANWRQRGSYYKARVIARDGDRVTVRYKDSGQVEQTTLANLRDHITPGRMLTPGRRVFAYWQSDGYWYPATLRKHDGEQFTVLFDDGVTAVLAREQVTLVSVWPNRSVEADYLGRGTYYSARVKRVDGKQVHVRYVYDGIVERTTLSRLRVKQTTDFIKH